LTISSSDVTTGTKTVSVTLDKICAVSFTLTPASAILIVKDSSSQLIAPVGGVYNLKAGSYTYSAVAISYISAENEPFTISAEDATAGTKTIEVTLEPVVPAEPIENEGE